MRESGWIVAAIAGLFAAIFFWGLLMEERDTRNYRHQVELCATTADDQSEFANCVEVVR